MNLLKLTAHSFQLFLQKSSIHHLVGSDFGVALFRVLVDHGHNVLVIFEVNVILT